MSPSVVQPLEAAWNRVRRFLLQPFDLERWLVLGFAAFLAALPRLGGWGSGPSGLRVGLDLDPGDLLRSPVESLGEVVGSAPWLLFGLPFALVGLLLGVLLLWVGSRGKFVFLDGVLRERAAIAQPWNDYGRLGNSLFLWRLGFYAAATLAFTVLLGPPLLLARGLSDSGAGRSAGAVIVVAAAAVALVLAIAVAYVLLFLDAFIVPLMYRYALPASAAWRRFAPLLRRNLVDFLIYGVAVAAAMVALAVALALSAVISCCIVPLLLAIPYVSSVLLLPLSGLYRLFSVEYLLQFGPEWSAYAPPDEAPSAPPTDDSPAPDERPTPGP